MTSQFGSSATAEGLPTPLRHIIYTLATGLWHTGVTFSADIWVALDFERILQLTSQRANGADLDLKNSFHGLAINTRQRSLLKVASKLI